MRDSRRRRGLAERRGRSQEATILTKTDFTSDEWNVVRRAPFTAGLVVVAASPSGPIGVVKEMFAVSKTLADVKLRPAGS